MTLSNALRIATFFAVLVAAVQVDACQRYTGYTDNGDGTLTDPRTQIVWQKCYQGQVWNGTDCNGGIKQMSWFEAMSSAKNNNFLSKSDWRIPTITEFESIVDHGCSWEASGNQDSIIASSLAQVERTYNGKRLYSDVWTSNTTYEDSDGEINEDIKSGYKHPPHPYFFLETGRDKGKLKNFSTYMKSLNRASRLIRGGNKRAGDLFEAKLKKEAYPTAAEDYDKQVKFVDLSIQRRRDKSEPERERERLRKFNSEFYVGAGVRSYMWESGAYGYSGQVVSTSYGDRTVRVKISNVDSGIAAHLNPQKCSQNKFLEKYGSVGMIIEVSIYCF